MKDLTPTHSGLYQSEYKVRQDANNTGQYYRRETGGIYTELTERFPQFQPSYWAGIDCSGFTQRTASAAKGAAPGMNITIPDRPADINAAGHFIENIVHYNANTGTAAERVKLIKKLRKGDLVQYGRSHISVIYTDRPTCTTNQQQQTSCSYEIIHAYGGDTEGMYRYPDIPEAGENRARRVFGRKVIKTFNNITQPSGFGRIKIWN